MYFHQLFLNFQNIENIELLIVNVIFMLLQLFNAKIQTKLKIVKALFYYYLNAGASMAGGQGGELPTQVLVEQKSRLIPTCPPSFRELLTPLH